MCACVDVCVNICVFGINTENKHYHLKLPVGVHEAYNRIGLPEIQYVNPLRASALHTLILLSCFSATSVLREAHKEQGEKKRGHFKDSEACTVL